MCFEIISTSTTKGKVKKRTLADDLKLLKKELRKKQRRLRLTEADYRREFKFRAS